MNELTDCKPYFDIRDSIIRIINNQVSLSTMFESQFKNWKSIEILPKTVGLINVLAANNKQQSIDIVYSIVASSDKLNENKLNWLNYYYKFAKRDYVQALNQLQTINIENEMEANTLSFETIMSTMHLNNLQPYQLPKVNISTLKQLANNDDVTSHKAADLLRLAIGGYDYKFEPIVISAPTHTKGIKSLFESNLKVYPNPASNQLQLEFINASDANAVIVINNATGQVIFSQSTNLKAGKITLDISTFAKGMYHLQVLGVEDKNLVATFIKQ